jgi:hypothetical protein
MLRQFIVADDNKTCLGFGVMCPICAQSDFSHNLNFLNRFSYKSPNLKFHVNPSSGSRANTCGQTDMTKVIGVFRDYANALKTATCFEF